MRIIRHDNGEATLLGDDDEELLDLIAIAAAGDAFAGLLDRLEAALTTPPLPRIVVGYREGLIETVSADLPCEVVLIEEDPFDEPAVSVVRRLVRTGDHEATGQAIAEGERRAMVGRA
jgi:hypothetical protein